MVVGAWLLYVRCLLFDVWYVLLLVCWLFGFCLLVSAVCCRLCVFEYCCSLSAVAVTFVAVVLFCLLDVVGVFFVVVVGRSYCCCFVVVFAVVLVLVAC